MEINSLAGYFFGITDFFEPSPPHNCQRIDTNTDATNNTTKTTHTDTYKHKQTHHPFPAQIQTHFIPSGTRLAQEHHPHKSSAWCEVPRQKIEPCVQREPTGRATIVIAIERVIEREEKSIERKR